MAIVSNAEFLLHQGYLGSGYASLVQIQNVLQSGVNLVVASHDAQVELDLLSPYVANAESMDVTASASLLRQATVALERHITDGTGQTFNDYLFTNGLKVGRDFASLSGLLGVTINPVNIGS